MPPSQSAEQLARRLAADPRVAFAEPVDLGSPGVSIASTVPGGRYAYLSGTSMAAPHVSGAASLVRAVRPDLSASQVVSLLEGSTRPLPSLNGTTKTGGLLDARPPCAPP